MVASQHSELVAKKWAKALMELADEDKGISKDDILDDLREVAENFEASPELFTALNNPSISVEEKQIILCKLFQNKLLPIVYNFIIVLNLRKRVGIIADIAVEFQKELEESRNIVRVNVTSAIDLNDEKKNEVKDRIADNLHKDVVVDWTVDDDIIAGLIFNVNETIVDNSIRHKLDNLSKSIMKG